MVTTKTRINVRLSSDVERALITLAKRDQVPEATKAAKLLRTALEIDEDVRLDVIASERDKKKVKFVSHNLAWL